jgi:hypothetical protein
MRRFQLLKTTLGRWTEFKAIRPPAAHASGSRVSRPEIIAMVVTAILGIGGLSALTVSVTKPEQDSPYAGITVRRECVSLWLHPALHDLASRLAQSAELQSREAFVRNAEQPGLKDAWYIITLRLVQANGKSAIVSVIQRPYESLPAFSSEFPDVLATAAGRPPHSALVDYSRAEVGIVPARLLSLDPREAFEELRMLERLPTAHTAP